jgi:two-component system, OmpR family, sensor histidine kinase BaeS
MKSLFAKILLAQVVAVVLALCVVMAITRSSLDRGFIGFLERQEKAVLEYLAPALAELYSEQGGWAFLRDRPENWRRVLRQARQSRTEPGAPEPWPPGLREAGPRDPGTQEPGPYEPGPSEPAPHAALHPAGDEPLHWLRPFDRLRLRDRLFVLDHDRKHVAGAAATNVSDLRLEAIEAGGAVVGWIGFVPMREGVPPEAQRFLHEQLRVLVASLLIALGLAALLGYALARHLSRPVRRLDETVRDLSRGQFEKRAQVAGGDEIGRLGANVNRLAETLEKNRSARRRWMADIAHELRTPLAILKGEVAALSDGVRQADERMLASLGEEIDHLSALVDDLQALALADAGALNLRQEHVDLRALTRQVCEAFRDRLAGRNIGLELATPHGVTVSADLQRLGQLLHNLLENCVRYVETGGHVRVGLELGVGSVSGSADRAADQAADQVAGPAPRPAARVARLVVEDSGPGVGDGQLERLFERFYRVEEGRSRAGGGSGLGLSICRSIAEAHGGRIWATRSRLGGLAVHLELPAAEASRDAA